MKPTLRRRFLRRICKVFGHRSQFSHIDEGSRHYICKRCGAIGVSLPSLQMRAILEQIEELEEKEEKMK